MSGQSTEKGPYRLCCCHGHLDGLSLDEMRALGAPCPTEKAVQERMAQAFRAGYAHAQDEEEADRPLPIPPEYRLVLSPGQAPQ